MYYRVDVSYVSSAHKYMYLQRKTPPKNDLAGTTKTKLQIFPKKQVHKKNLI